MQITVTQPNPIELAITDENIVLDIPATPDIVLELSVAQGPSGVYGISTYATRVDVVSDTLIYRGEAATGSTDGSLVWRISKIQISGNSFTVTWADGNSNFDNSWTNRSTYTYS